MWSQRGAFLSQAKHSHFPSIGTPAPRYINQRLSESRPAARPAPIDVPQHPGAASVTLPMSGEGATAAIAGVEVWTVFFIGMRARTEPPPIYSSL